MPQWLDLVWLMLLLFVLGWGAGAALAPFALRGLEPAGPPRRVRRRLGLIAALPLALPVAAVTGLVLLALGKQLGWLPDHCPIHGSSGHPHFCFAHLPDLAWTHMHRLFALASVAAVVVLPARPLGRAWMQQRHVRQLNQMASRKGALRILDTGERQAFAAGLRRPRVFLSRGLLAGLSARERRIVMAHEVAHIRHRDLAAQLVFECLLGFHRPACARVLRQVWRQNREARADDRAAERFGALEVASTLLRLARQPDTPAPAGLSALGDDPAARIERLLQPPRPVSGVAGFEWGYAVAATGLITLTITAHHSLETLLGHVPGVAQ
jgi:hypothetical protein